MKTKKVRRIKKAYKVYGADKGDAFLKLFYSYDTIARLAQGKDCGRELSDYRTAFNLYVQKKYGKDFTDEYWAFYRKNKDNKTLIRVLDKKKSDFLVREVLNLTLEKPEKKQKPDSDLYAAGGGISEKKKEQLKGKEEKKEEKETETKPVVKTEPKSEKKADTSVGEKTGKKKESVSEKKPVSSPVVQKVVYLHLQKRDGRPIEKSDVYRYRSAVDNIMMTNTYNQPSAVFICPVCDRKVETVVRWWSGTRKCVCPCCKNNITIKS